jgi:tetratricopeptide (TPR) repeat protein
MPYRHANLRKFRIIEHLGIAQTLAGKPRMRGIFAKVLCAVLAAALLAACDGPEQRVASHLDRGKAFFQEKNYDKARIEFRNVLQINPRNVDGRYALALVDEAEGNLRQAFAGFRQASEQKPDHLPSLIKIGQYYLAGNQMVEVMDQAKAILALDPKNADAFVLRGAVHLRQNELALARHEIDQALLAEPDNLSAVSALVGIERKAGHADAALEILAKALENHPDEPGLRLLQAQLLIEQGALDKAGEVFRLLIEKEPDNLGYKTSFVKLLIRQDRKDDAEAFLRRLAESAQSPEAKLLWIDFLLNQQSFAQAEKALLGLIGQNPADLTYRFSLAGIYLRQNEQVKAVQVYRDIIALDRTGPKGLIARAALAQVYIVQGEKEAARALVAEVLTADPNNTEALLLRARDRLADGDNDGAIADLRTLLRVHPELTGGRALLAEAHVRNNEPALAIEALRALLEASPENQAVRVALARQLAGTGETDSALALLNEALSRVPDDLAALRVQAGIYAGQSNWPALVDTATAMIKQTKEPGLSHYIRGQAYLMQRRFDEAAADFTAALKFKPDTIEPLAGLVRAHLGRNDDKAAEAIILKRLSEAPDNPAVHNLLGELYLATGKTGPAEAAFQAVLKSNKAYAPAYVNLARIAVQAGDFDQAIAFNRDGLAAVPGDETLSLGLASAYMLKKDFSAAMDIYEAMLARNSNLPVVANNLAALIADFESEDKARLAHALELAKIFDNSKNPFYLDTLGWVHYRLGNIQQALSYLEQAVAKAPDSPQLNYHLGMAYRDAGQIAKARAALDRAVVEGAEYPGLQTARAALADM